jgi:hypothetical protein
MELDTVGQHVPGFKYYIMKYRPVDLGWKIKPWFKIDLDMLRAWYSDLERNFSDCKFVYGDNMDAWSDDPLGDDTGRTGHIMPPTSAWYVLSYAGTQQGALPPVNKGIVDRYKEEWDENDQLNPRYCFTGYAKEIIDSMEFPVKKIQVSSMAPGHELILHQDSTNWIRFHVAIDTNEYCYWEIEGERIHIPADGWVYLINTSLPHRVYNRGTTDRIHLYGKVNTQSIINAQSGN